MAGNDWLNSYLEAILDVGPGLDDAKSSLLLRERGRFSPTRYFVEEVIGFDETDLYRSWVRASTSRSPQERNTRLENMCWRIWNLARQKKQVGSISYPSSSSPFPFTVFWIDCSFAAGVVEILCWIFVISLRVRRRWEWLSVESSAREGGGKLLLTCLRIYLKGRGEIRSVMSLLTAAMAVELGCRELVPLMLWRHGLIVRRGRSSTLCS